MADERITDALAPADHADADAAHDTGHTLQIVGVGPGDPELLTIKAARLIAAAPTVAFFAKRGRPGHARTVAQAHFAPDVVELRLEFPFTTEIALDDPRYMAGMEQFYDGAAARVANALATGDVALLCEGDPLFYGSSLVMLDRLEASHSIRITPGVCGMSGCWSQAALPMAHGDDVLSVLPGTLDEDSLTVALTQCDAAVIVKVGRHMPKVRSALRRAGQLDQAVYVEHGTMANERVLPLATVDPIAPPYRSLVLVPGRRRAR